MAFGDFLTVDGAVLPAPDTYTWGEQDVSAPNAGRTQDANATMHKMLITRKTKLSLGWTNLDLAAISSILTAFGPEYVQIRYLDARAGGYLTKVFYVGDRSAPFRYATVNGNAVLSLTFNVIER